MLLVDKDIEQYVNKNTLIIQGYSKENLNGVSYDLTIDTICDENGDEIRTYELKPGEVIFIKTLEQLKIPTHILGRIAEKNSRMRQGLKVDGPHYQPGHITYAFLRVQNISTKIITLQHGMKIAQIIFEQLTQEPAVPYSSQPVSSFQNEVQYKGLGNYKEEYTKQTKEQLEKAKEDIEDLSHKIYANVLTLMGILVAIFSLISINYQAFTNSAIDIRYIIVMNVTLALSIVVMMGIILIFINKAKNTGFLVVYTIVLIALAAVTLGLSLPYLC